MKRKGIVRSGRFQAIRNTQLSEGKIDVVVKIKIGEDKAQGAGGGGVD